MKVDEEELWRNRQQMLHDESEACTPGHEEHCGLALEPVCTCRCGGKNHGILKKVQTDMFPDERTEADE